jgi:hypothetical protein
VPEPAGGATPSLDVYGAVLERQRQLIADAFADIAPDALAHRRAFRDQVVEYMRAAHGLGVGPPPAAPSPAPPAAGEPDAGSFLIFAARSDVLPRGYYQPGISLYRPFSFADLAAARAFMAERLALGENVYVRAAPASAAELGQTLVFSEYPDIAITAFHEALHNRIQLPLAIEEPLHTLLAVALAEAFAASLPAGTDADQRLARWVAEGARELRQRFVRSADRYQQWLGGIAPEQPAPSAINEYALELLAAFRRSPGSDAQQRHGRTHAPPYWTPSLSRDLRIASLEPAEQGLIGTAFLADHSTYERRFAEVHRILAPHLEPGRIIASLTALMGHTVPDQERWSFDIEAEDRALTWLAETL